MLLKKWVRSLLLLTHGHFKFCVEGLHMRLNADRWWGNCKWVYTNLLIVLPSVFQCASPVFPASSSLHPAVALELPMREIYGKWLDTASVLGMRIPVALLLFIHPPSHLLLLKGFFWGFLDCLQCSRIVYSLCEAHWCWKYLKRKRKVISNITCKIWK